MPQADCSARCAIGANVQLAYVMRCVRSHQSMSKSQESIVMCQGITPFVAAADCALKGMLAKGEHLSHYVLVPCSRIRACAVFNVGNFHRGQSWLHL